jgi:hypothetical protein
MSRGVDWVQAEKLCFNEWSNPDDEELGVQIVKVSPDVPYYARPLEPGINAHRRQIFLCFL